MLIVREERILPKSDKEPSLPLLNILAQKIAENVRLFRHFQAETRYVKQGHHPGITRGSPTIFGLYRCSPSCISGLSHIIAA